MKRYNTTDLDPVSTFERHVFHRDQFAHYLRWSHIVKEAKIGETVVDFGCGKGNMLEVFYRNKFIKMFEELKAYYDSNLLSVIIAPFFPEQSRNTLWVLKRK